MELNTYHWIGMATIGVVGFLWVSLWVVTTIERAWNRRRRERMRWQRVR